MFSIRLAIFVLTSIGTAHLGHISAKSHADDKPKQQTPTAIAGPLSPADSLQHFHLGDSRYQIELVVSEPDVQDPVAAQFDEKGRLWVVEMGDYPYGPAKGEEPKSRIKILEDRDRDGRYETVKVFADKLLFATELQLWKGGAIVTLAGEVAYLRDNDGDGKADQRETWYRGFAQENSQLRANHPRLALDGWVYVSNGLRGGSVVNVRRPDEKPIALAGKDFRFHPITHACEAVTGVGQFGLTFDDFGNRFICSNRNPLMHVVLEERYIQRNPNYAPTAARHDVARAGEESRIYALSRAWTTSNLHAGQFTAACGVLIYRGGQLPPEYYGGGFTCDPTGNLVHGEIVRPSGATFTSQPTQQGVEFLASPDEWFRPVNLFNGPDGALYVVDMYRAVIEHPDFMPDELKKRPDLMLGTDRGRIWRIVSKDAVGRNKRSAVPATNPVEVPQLSDESSNQLATRLSEVGWMGDTACRLLYEREDQVETKALEEIASRGDGVGAIRALWLLQHAEALTESVLQSALQASDARLREQAVALAEIHSQDKPHWRAQIAKLADDGDARVRFQVALSLTPVRESSETVALQKIATVGANDEWTRRAVALAAGSRAGELALSILTAANEQQKTPSAGSQALLQDLFAIVSAQRDQQNLLQLLGTICSLPDSVTTPAVRRALVLAFAESIGRSGTNLTGLAEKLDGAQRDQLQHLFQLAKTDLHQGEDLQERIKAAQLLGFDENSRSELAVLVRYSNAADAVPTELRLRILSGLARQPKYDGWSKLLDDWPRESPAFRRGLLDSLLARPDRTLLLLSAIETGSVKASELESSVSNRLLKHGQAEVREKSQKLLASLIPEDRQKVLQDYKPVLQLKADSLNGRQVFTKNCSTCHRIGELGVNVAPDISDSRVKQPEQLLTDILQPNRAIDNNYLSYTVVSTEGITLTGVIASETGTSITLRQQEGKETTLLRSNIDELRSNGVSLMPEGLEKNISPQEMADLIAFIKNWRYLDGRTPLAQ